MRRATEVLTAGNWPTEEAVSAVTLDYDDRFRRRIRLVDDGGEAFLLDLADATRLGDGDGLRLDCGGIVRVCAAEEEVVDLRCHGLRETARVAWHIGNRHIPIQVLEDGGLRIRADHVIAEMAVRLGAHAEAKRAPFAPEPGAYAAGSQGEHGGHGHHHDH
jgi:urease accessory protein